MKNHGKSNFSRPKENTKSMIEKNLEEEQFKKYDAIVNKLILTVSNKDKILSRTDDDFSNKRTPSLGKNKSNFKVTVSRTKDDRNDKDFLSTFMNNDSLPILPKNLHLLSDNDTNQSISNTDKFKNLANLMIDDRESYSENCFIRNSEDRLILKLYTILGRQSKEIFLEEESNEKLSKKRLLFHKLNDIKIPKFDFNKPNNIENKKIENFEENNEENEKENNNEKKDEKENNDENGCYFKKEEKKGYFHMPELINIKEYKRKSKYIGHKEKDNNEKFWDPEIDSDILSYINHNIIRIEDIYNSKESYENEQQKNNINIEDLDEDKIIAVNAQEIISSDSENEDNEDNYIKDQLRINNKYSNINEEEEIPKKSKIKFSEFCGISPYQIEVSCQVDNERVKEAKTNADLRDKHTTELNKISAYDEKNFPTYGLFLSNDLIHRIASKNEYNEIEENESFTIEATRKSTLKDNSSNSMQRFRKDIKKKTMVVKAKNLLSSITLSGSQFTLKNSLLNENETFSPVNNAINSNKDEYKNKNEEKKEDNNYISVKNKNDEINISNIINKNSKVEENKEIEDNEINKEKEENENEEKKENEIIDENKENEEKKNNNENKENNDFIENEDNNENNNKEKEKNHIKIKNNIMDNIKREYTLKDLINNDSILSIKNNNLNNNSHILSENESFSIMNDKNNISNFKNNNFNFGDNNIKEKDENQIKENDEKNSKNNSISRLYSDNQSGSQRVKNDFKIELTFSSRQSKQST